MCSPHVRFLGPDTAVISYVRLTQIKTGEGVFKTNRADETRVWNKENEKWQCVHFHRSDNGSCP